MVARGIVPPSTHQAGGDGEQGEAHDLEQHHAGEHTASIQRLSRVEGVHGGAWACPLTAIKQKGGCMGVCPHCHHH